MKLAREVLVAARLALLLGCLLAAPAASPQESTLPPAFLAVLEFRDQLKGPHDDIDAAFFADQVREAVRSSRLGLKIISRENVQVLLSAQGKSLADCEGECEVDTGKKLGADFVISGELLRIGSSLKLNMKLHDTKTAVLLRGATASGKDADALDAALRNSVGELLSPLGDVQRVRAELLYSGENDSELAQVENAIAHAKAELLKHRANPQYEQELAVMTDERIRLASQSTQLGREGNALYEFVESGNVGTNRVRTADFHARCSELRDQIQRSHTRIMLLTESIFGSPPR